jgi:hypothetical protein
MITVGDEDNYHEICLSKTGDVIDCQFFRDEIEQREMADLNIQL